MKFIPGALPIIRDYYYYYYYHYLRGRKVMRLFCTVVVSDRKIGRSLKRLRFRSQNSPLLSGHELNLFPTFFSFVISFFFFFFLFSSFYFVLLERVLSPVSGQRGEPYQLRVSLFSFCVNLRNDRIDRPFIESPSNCRKYKSVFSYSVY